MIAKHEQYLCVNISRLAVFDSLDDASGDLSVYATLDWAGA
jgi:hypothetical protein